MKLITVELFFVIFALISGASAYPVIKIYQVLDNNLDISEEDFKYFNPAVAFVTPVAVTVENEEVLKNSTLDTITSSGEEVATVSSVTQAQETSTSQLPTSIPTITLTSTKREESTVVASTNSYESSTVRAIDEEFSGSGSGGFDDDEDYKKTEESIVSVTPTLETEYSDDEVVYTLSKSTVQPPLALVSSEKDSSASTSGEKTTTASSVTKLSSDKEFGFEYDVEDFTKSEETSEVTTHVTSEENEIEGGSGSGYDDGGFGDDEDFTKSEKTSEVTTEVTSEENEIEGGSGSGYDDGGFGDFEDFTKSEKTSEVTTTDVISEENEIEGGSGSGYGDEGFGDDEDYSTKNSEKNREKTTERISSERDFDVSGSGWNDGEDINEATLKRTTEAAKSSLSSFTTQETSEKATERISSEEDFEIINGSGSGDDEDSLYSSKVTSVKTTKAYLSENLSPSTFTTQKISKKPLYRISNEEEFEIISGSGSDDDEDSTEKNPAKEKNYETGSGSGDGFSEIDNDFEEFYVRNRNGLDLLMDDERDTLQGSNILKWHLNNANLAENMPETESNNNFIHEIDKNGSLGNNIISTRIENNSETPIKVTNPNTNSDKNEQIIKNQIISSENSKNHSNNRNQNNKDKFDDYFIEDYLID